MLLVCPSCEAVNRMPDERVSDDPNCGACGRSLLTKTPATLGSGSFDKFINRTELPVLVDFWAEWCGPCKMMAPQFAQAAAELAGQVQLAKVDTEQNQALAARFAIRSIPTLALFRRGREIDRLAGAVSKNDLLVWVNLPRP